MTPRQVLRLVLVGLGTSVVPLDTAVNIAFPELPAASVLPVEMIQWVVICYVLTYASLMLAFGRVGDIWSHGRVFRIGLLWSGAAYLLCAAAPNYGWLLFCRFLQGIGASLIVSCAPALVTGLFPEDRRSRAVGMFTLMYAIGSAAGPLLGGVLVQFWGWPAVFWFRAPLALIALLFLEGVPAASRSAAREPVDIVGAVLLALGISTLLLMLNRLQHLKGRKSSHSPAGRSALASLFGFVRWESRGRPADRQPRFVPKRRLRACSICKCADLFDQLFGSLVRPLLPRALRRSVGGRGGRGSRRFVCRQPCRLTALRDGPSSVSRPGRVAALGASLCAAGLVLIGGWQPGAAGQTIAILAHPGVTRIWRRPFPSRLYGHRHADSAAAPTRSSRQHRDVEPLGRRRHRGDAADPRIPHDRSDAAAGGDMPAASFLTGYKRPSG